MANLFSILRITDGFSTVDLLGGNKGPVFDAEPTLKAGGCRIVRLLAEKEGLRFVEGTKARI